MQCWRCGEECKCTVDSNVGRNQDDWRPWRGVSTEVKPNLSQLILVRLSSEQATSPNSLKRWPLQKGWKNGIVQGRKLQAGGGVQESLLVQMFIDYFHKRGAKSYRGSRHRVHTEWQLPPAGVHFNMMEKLAQSGEGGGCTPTPFHFIYHHVQSCGVRSS